MKRKKQLFEAYQRESASLEIYCSLHPMEILRPRLRKVGAVTAKELLNVASGATVLISGLLIFFHTPPTRSGKRVIFATLEDETGLFDLTILPHVQERWGQTIYESKILTSAGKVRREGYRGRAISITVTRIVTELSGDLTSCI